MDVSFSNVLEGTRQYFMGVPKPMGEGSGQPVWPAGAPPEEGAPAQSGAPTQASRPPSAAAAPAAPPPRPPSEPIEPEPHIIHKATVMREAAEKRREQPDVDDETESDAQSPPPHVIHRPAHALPSPAPAPAAPSPSPARPPSAAPHLSSEPAPHEAPYRPPNPVHTPTARPPDPFTPTRPPDQYSASRPPEAYARYHYDPGPVAASPQPAPPPRHSPQTYARLSSSMPQHSRLREAPAQSPPVPTQRYSHSVAQPNDRVPPIHHPPQRGAPGDGRSPHPPPPPCRETSPYSRVSSHYDRHPTLPLKKYDPQLSYPGYRPAPLAPQPIPPARVEPHQHVQYKHVVECGTARGYPPRPLERVPVSTQPYPHDSRHQPHDSQRRADYPTMSKPAETARNSYHYPTPSTSSRYPSSTPAAPMAPVVQNATMSSRTVHRPVAAPKSNYEYPTTNQLQTSPARSTSKPGYPNQQARMTVSVTSLVNQMNQTKQKRESPLDLSVKTVKNSADSSTTQDDVVDSATSEKHLPIPPLPTASIRPVPGPGPVPTASVRSLSGSGSAPGFVESHKVDFAPNFTQCRDRGASAINHSYGTAPQTGHPPVRFNGTYEPPRPIPELSYPVEPRHTYPERSKYPPSTARPEYVPRIDLTRPVIEERRQENRIRDDRHFIIEERKRPSGPIVSNIPEKMVRYETWAADSRIDRMAQSAREQHELMSRPVYSYSSHQQFEAYQNEQKRAAAASTAYREQHPVHQNHKYPPYPEPSAPRDRSDSYGSYHDRTQSISNRHVIQKIPSHRDVIPHHIDHHSGVPADKRVLSILRNSLETKHTGLEPARPTRPMPDVIVLDDVDDPVIEITDDAETAKNACDRSRISYSKLTDSLGQHIKMPKAVDSLPNDSDYQRHETLDTKSSPENDVARIRTKAELKSLPAECSMKHDVTCEGNQTKLLPKSQKQHLFNQMRQDNLRFESVIKSERHDTLITAVKPEPMNIDEIEKDAVIPIKTENLFESLQPDMQEPCELPEEDNDWASACDNFMEQLKTGVHKKKSPRKRTDTLDRDNESAHVPKLEPVEKVNEKDSQESNAEERAHVLTEKSTADLVVIKQEPTDDTEINQNTEHEILTEPEMINTSVEKLDSKDGLIKDEEHNDKEQSIQSSKTEIERDNKIITSPQKVTPKHTLNKDQIKSRKRSSHKDLLEKDKDGCKSKKSSLCDEKANNKIQKSDKNKTLVKYRHNKKIHDQEKIEDSKLTKTTSKLTTLKPKNKSNELNKESKEVPTKDTTSKPAIPESKNKSNELNKESKEVPAKDKNKLNSKNDVLKTPKKNDNKLDTKQDVLKSPKKNDKKVNTKQDIVNAPKNDENEPKISVKVNTKQDVVKSPQKDENSSKISLRDKIKAKGKLDKNSSVPKVSVKKETEVKELVNTVIKVEPDSTDDDEPLINRKLLKDKEMKYQVLKDLSEKSAYVKLECFDVDMNKNTRLSIESFTKDKEDKSNHKKTLRRASRLKGKSQSLGNSKEEIQRNDTSTSDDEELTVASRLRVRKITKTEDGKPTAQKSSVKSSPKKQQESSSSNSTPVKKSSFGDGSDFHPGWEEELYRYKRSLRMPARLIAMPRGRSGGPFPRGGSGAIFNRGSTSLPDLDPAPLSPAPSLASAATDDLYARRQDKLNIDSDLESNSSYSAFNRLQYDSEASSSTVLSSSKKKTGSIVDVLMQKCGKKEDSKRRGKDKDEKTTPKIIPKSTISNELLPTPSLGLIKNCSKGVLSAKKEKLMEDIFYLGAFRKETVTAFRNDFINNTDGLIGAIEEFAPVVLKTRTRTESRVLKHRATIREVFGDERPASAPPTSCRSDDEKQDEDDDKLMVKIKQEKETETETEAKPKLKPKKIGKDKVLRRSSTIRDGLRSTKSLKRNDANGRLMRLKKRNSLVNSKRIKDFPANKVKKEKTEDSPQEKPTEGSSGTVEVPAKRRLKRLFGRRKLSSGFDYIRKKKKIVRRDESSTPTNKIRRPAVKPSPESVHDIQKEMKGWIINKSVGETHLHRAARLGYTDCVAYCLEKMSADPSAKDNAGYTPLHVAAQKGHVRIARLLLQYGANVSAAAQGGIRPLHEASENCHVEVMRLLLSYGADPLLGTYAGQTPEELTEGPAARFLRLYIADVQGHTIEPWRFPHPADIIDREELGCDPLSSPPPGSPAPPPDSTIEIQCTEAPLPPFYSLRSANGQPADGLWCLLQDVTTILQIKSKDSLLKQIHCGSGSPKELLREIRTQEFLERAQCHQLLCAGEKVNVRASKVSLVRVTDKLRQLLKIETVLVS